MRIFAPHWLKGGAAHELARCARHGEFDGRMDAYAAQYLESCKGFHSVSGTLLIFTRDSGHHTSGWFKNPDYERCLHLSLSFRRPFDPTQQSDFDNTLAKDWCEYFFSAWTRYIWEESAKSPEGKALEVRHYRVFCDENWQPIIPRGEVYSKELTEIGWKSWSEQHPEDPKEPSILDAG